MVRKTVTAEIKKLGINGEGIAYLDKKITFVQGALPREVVEIEICLLYTSPSPRD